MALSPGTRLGPYEIVDGLGAGGMGEVFRARDAKLKRDVAIKVLPDAFANDAERLARFNREAQALAALNHPHIAQIYGLEESSGVFALVMELVEGEDLSQRIARGAVPLDEALLTAKQIAEALQAAHEQGIIHRDLKPANVKVRLDGMVKVLDFGLAKATDPIGGGPNESQTPTITTPAMLTARGIILGTAAYMAPEQARGKAVDKRADIWAFGCVLFEMLTGRRPFGGETISDTLVSILEREPDWAALPAGTPTSIRRLLERCLRKDPRKRLHDIADALIEIDEREPGLAPPEGVGIPASAPRRLNRERLGWLAALVAVAVLMWVFSRADSTGLPTPNSVPVIVLMDSPLPGRVYDPRTRDEGGTNADDVTDALRTLLVAIRKENTSAVWHREEQVVAENPDLIVSHLSCFLDARVGQGQPDVSEHLLYQAEERLLLFLAYVASRNPRTRFLVYSRSVFQTHGGEEKWVGKQIARLPVLRNRLNAFIVPGGQEKASFREPDTANLIRARVTKALELAPQ